jgi:hypothetical protein
LTQINTDEEGILRRLTSAQKGIPSERIGPSGVNRSGRIVSFIRVYPR